MKVNVLLIRKTKGYVHLMRAINIVLWKLQKKENDKINK
jgi:hypothetical protein